MLLFLGRFFLNILRSNYTVDIKENRVSFIRRSHAYGVEVSEDLTTIVAYRIASNILRLAFL